MRISIVIASLLLISLQRQGYGETVEVSLPELTGKFKGNGFYQSTTVHLDRPPDSVRHVWMRLIGVVTPGLVECMIFPDSPWLTDLTVETWDAVGRAWWYAGAGVPKPAEIGVQRPFDVMVEFHPMTGATWETLMSGQFVVYLSTGPTGLIGVCIGVTPPHGSVTDVRLIIEGDFPTAVSPSTWGQLKSLWRN
jgi:hypothetical protein